MKIGSKMLPLDIWKCIATKSWTMADCMRLRRVCTTSKRAVDALTVDDLADLMGRTKWHILRGSDRKGNSCLDIAKWSIIMEFDVEQVLLQSVFELLQVWIERGEFCLFVCLFVGGIIVPVLYELFAGLD